MKKILFLSAILLLQNSAYASQNLLKLMDVNVLPQSFRATSRFLHSAQPILEINQEKPKAMQVFTRPTYDRIAKYVLSQDEAVRIDILKAFTGIESITSAVQLDEHYNPFDPLHTLRKLVNSTSSKSLFESIRNSSSVELLLDQKENRSASEILKGLGGLYDDMINAFPDSRYRASVDFLCESNLGYLTIEFQVAKQDYWDKRALAYIAGIYGNQLRPNQRYSNLLNVIGVNLLGDGSTPYWKDGAFVRDYTFTNQRNSRNRIPAMRLLQYSLGDANLDHPELKKNDKLRGWIEFFKSAHDKQEIPKSINEPMKKAYNMIKVDDLKVKHPELLKASEEFFASLTEHDQAVEEKGKLEGKLESKIQVAQNLIKNTKLSDQEIADATGIPLFDIETLRKS